MSRDRSIQSFVTRRAIAAALFASTLSLLQPTPLSAASAASWTPISNLPVTANGGPTVKPNLLFTLDDSGSMNMASVGEDFQAMNVGMYARACNAMAYDPTVAYVLPPLPSDIATPLALPAATDLTWVDGFAANGFPGGGTPATVDLRTKFVIDDLDGSTNNDAGPREAFYFSWSGAGVPGSCWRNVDDTDLATIGWSQTRWSALSAEAKQNFRIWYAFYRTRLLAMKSAAARAFAQTGSGIRVGLITINQNDDMSVNPAKYFPIRDFDPETRRQWIEKLYGLTAAGETPLHYALARAGRHFAGIDSGLNKNMNEDPVQYSCQRNFTLLATDGYWSDDRLIRRIDDTDGSQADAPPAVAPFSDKITLEARAQTQTGHWWSSESTGYCSGLTITQPGHPDFGSTQLTLWDGSKVDAFNELALFRESSRSTVARPLGYPERWGPWSAAWSNVWDSDWPYWRTDNYSGATPFAWSDLLSSLPATFTGTSTFVQGRGTLPARTWEYGHVLKRAVVDSGGASRACVQVEYYCNSAAESKGCSYGAVYTPPSPGWVLSGSMTTIPAFDVTMPGTLADVAMYYYQTDLRTESINPNNRQTGTPVFSNGTLPGSVASGWETQEADVAPHQHMTTFTLGFGLSGFVDFDPNYYGGQNDPSVAGQHFAQIRAGTRPWLGSVKEWWMSGEAWKVDDLWHAAVNGRGRYLSAQDPQQLYASLVEVMNSVTAVTSSGSGAAVSSYLPVSANNFLYGTTYQQGTWAGELSKVSIDLTPGATLASLSAPSESAATRLAAKVGRDCDDRTIYLMVGSTRRDFTWDTKRCASGTISSGIGPASSWAEWATYAPLLKTTAFPAFTSSVATRPNPADSDLVNYVRGQWGKERRSPAVAVADRWFRERTTPLGALIGSQPVHVGAPAAGYGDSGYSEFKAAKAGRAKRIYVGSDDGMLHAFDADTLDEAWAIVPSLMLPNLSLYANESFRADHRFGVDGTAVVGDIFVPGLSGPDKDKWRTILVGGLNAGGRGFYAIDVTDPDAPAPLWEFSCTTSGAITASLCDVGLSFGNPVIVKRPDGKWVVLVTSGHNPQSGKAVLFVLDAHTGAVLARIAPTSEGVEVGSPSQPAGLTKITAWVDHARYNNTAQHVYGGDSWGRMWKFDISPGAESASLLATLVDSTGKVQSVTAAPELALNANTGERMVIIGTGRLLDFSDVARPESQSVYGLKDNGTSLTRADLNTCSVTDGVDRHGSCTGNASGGWVIDLPSQNERVTIAPSVQRGTLVFTTNVPNSGATDPCSRSASTVLYSLDFKTGSAIPTEAGVVGRVVADRFAVGVVMVLVRGRLTAYVATNSGTHVPVPVPTYESFSGRRVSWRELVQ